MNVNEFSDRIGEVATSLKEMTEDKTLLSDVIEVADLIAEAMQRGNKLLICGNGGSAADAQHMAGEFLCRFCRDRAPLPALALSTDTSVLTAISNDYSFGDVFGRQVMALGREGDLVLGISTSGDSENVRLAFKVAKGLGMKTILLTGNNAATKRIAPHSDIMICAPSSNTPRIQEMHLIIEHVICEAVERRVCG